MITWNWWSTVLTFHFIFIWMVLFSESTLFNKHMCQRVLASKCSYNLGALQAQDKCVLWRSVRPRSPCAASPPQVKSDQPRFLPLVARRENQSSAIYSAKQLTAHREHLNRNRRPLWHTQVGEIMQAETERNKSKQQTERVSYTNPLRRLDYDCSIQPT